MASTLHRLPYTPLQDLLRGHVTGRLDWRGFIASSEVAPEVKALVRSVVSRTRLSRVEQADVAAELLSHFLDGLDAGLTHNELIEAFGDPRQAARLLRRARIRGRSAARHLFHCTVRLIAILGVFYAGVAAYYYSGKPSPKADFIAAMNSQIERTPQQQRAWPVYRSALLASGAEDSQAILGSSAYGQHWPQIARWVDDHQAAIESLRQASGLPELGIIFGAEGAGADRPQPGVDHSNGSGNGPERVANVSMPQLRDLRILADLLAFDAKRAREQGDGKRVEMDIGALAGLAAQVAHGVPLKTGAMFSVGILLHSYEEIDRTLVQTPQVLVDAALVRIAHRISVPQTGSDLISFSGQRLLFEDVLQRTFTDDGNGDGHFSPAGWNFYTANFSRELNLPEAMSIESSSTAALQPASVLLMASRKELSSEFERLINLNEAVIHLPLRDADLNAPYDELRKLQSSLVSRQRYAVLLTLAPTLHRSAEIAERALGQRDGLLVGLALEMYHRRNGRYPDTLAQLTPGLLPTVPADRITGDPLKYRLIDGKPLVYSVGVDRIDDGGRVPVLSGKPDPNAAAAWGDFATVVSGDWILYPQPRVPEDETEN